MINKFNIITTILLLSIGITAYSTPAESNTNQKNYIDSRIQSLQKEVNILKVQLANEKDSQNSCQAPSFEMYDNVVSSERSDDVSLDDN